MRGWLRGPVKLPPKVVRKIGFLIFGCLCPKIGLLKFAKVEAFDSDLA
jgi:hypothetical protein